jgi:GTP-binding protein
MRFVDCVRLHIEGGHGGRGAIAWRREKFYAMGGPYGGNGGRGGDVVVEATRNLGTLLDLRYRRRIKAQDGAAGATKRQHGASGEHTVIRVPVGTLIRDAATGRVLADLHEDGQRAILARGGRGGLGNAAFKTSVRQAPTNAQPGEAGEASEILLELKLLADVALVGYPSVGKSTLISVLSNARPRIAAYPFTTLTPKLGIVKGGPWESFVMADIPGLIEGAHHGRGLGARFLRHIERCRILVHLIEVPVEGDPDRDALRDYEAIRQELALFSPALAARPELVVLTKCDLPAAREALPALQAHFAALDRPFFAISALTRDGLDGLVQAMMTWIHQTPPPDEALFTAPEESDWQGEGQDPEDDGFDEGSWVWADGEGADDDEVAGDAGD